LLNEALELVPYGAAGEIIFLVQAVVKVFWG